MNFEQIRNLLLTALDPNEYTISDISHEMWREYEYNGHVFRVDQPVALILRVGSTGHRIVDTENDAHYFPGPSTLGKAVALRWCNGDENSAVYF